MKMTAKEVLENLISTIEKKSTDNKAIITDVGLWVKSWREELKQVNNGVLDDVMKCDCELERHERSKMELDYNKCMDCKKEIQ